MRGDRSIGHKDRAVCESQLACQTYIKVRFHANLLGLARMKAGACARVTASCSRNHPWPAAQHKTITCTMVTTWGSAAARLGKRSAAAASQGVSSHGRQGAMSRPNRSSSSGACSGGSRRHSLRPHTFTDLHAQPRACKASHCFKHAQSFLHLHMCAKMLPGMQTFGSSGTHHLMLMQGTPCFSEGSQHGRPHQLNERRTSACSAVCDPAGPRYTKR